MPGTRATMSFPNEFARQFHELTLLLLTETERDDLHRSLKTYRRTHDLAKLAKASSHLLKTAERAKLLHYIRAPMTMPERLQFDRLLGMHGANSSHGSMTSLRVDHLDPMAPTPGNTRGTERYITVQGRRGGSMGFSIRGGSEFGLGIYVSAVRLSSPAGEADLRVGDQILSANGVDFGCVANSGAVKVLSSSALLRLVILRTGKVPEWKVAKERVLWYDTTLNRVVKTPPVGELQTRDRSYDIIEQKLVINIRNSTDYVGLNIRGGQEYGVGIYVSRTDVGGLASKAGICPGDQIIRVNDVNFLSVEHTEAVDVLRSNVHLIITIRSVGKYPVFRELCAEYTWSKVDNKKHTPVYENYPKAFTTFKGEGPSEHLTQRARAKESSIDLHPYCNIGQVNSGYQNDVEELNDGLQVQTELCYPSDNDIMFRRNYEDSWQQIDAINDNHVQSEEQNKSWTIDNRDSLEHYNHDSDMSDTGLDYTTFLEKNMAEKERKATVAKNGKLSNNNSFNSSATDNVPVIETVIEEAVTVFKSEQQNVNNVHNSYAAQQNVPVSPTSSRSSSEFHPVVLDGRKRGSAVKKSTKLTRAPDTPTSSQTSSARSSMANGEGDVDNLTSQIKQLEARKSHLGTWEITRVAGSSSSSIPSSPDLETDSKGGTWSTFKKKIKGSLRTKGPKKRGSLPSEAEFVGGSSSPSPSNSVHQKGVFQRSFGSQLNSPGLDRYNLMAVLEDHARKILTEDECKAVMRHVNNYHENKQLDRLVEMLLAILDKPEKKILLIDVRGIVYPAHLTRYDELMARCNVQGSTIIVQAPAPNSSPYVEERKVNGFSRKESPVETFAQYSKDDFKDSPEQLELIILENEDRENVLNPPEGEYEDFDGVETVYISKHKKFVGLKMEGGAESATDSVIRVKEVIPGGAASDDKRIQPGIEITEIDGKSMKGVTLKQAEAILDTSFRTKSPVNLGIEIRHSYHL